ncbi:hypothetical protein Tco_1077716 [Tanacetum coccineum]
MCILFPGPYIHMYLLGNLDGLHPEWVMGQWVVDTIQSTNKKTYMFLLKEDLFKRKANPRFYLVAVLCILVGHAEKDESKSASFLITAGDKKNATRTQQHGLFESRKLARRKVKECSKIARERTKKGSKKMQQKDSKNCVFERQESRKKSQQEE